ncbi:MAG TPA: GDP-mannose 4,6-dehydratase [Gemmatimonadaceae bacterium]|nr:GDP-mannose 4,6-dehydratase [Gemmatimonadaceae bacterium]
MAGRELFLVLGSNSFSGATFVDHILGQGAAVIGVSRSEEPHAAFLPYRWSGLDANFRFARLDINRDLDAIDALVRNERPRYIVNFAAQSMVAESWEHPEHWFTTNVVSTVRLHERLRQMEFLRKYVHVTTPEVYGSTSGFVREDAPFNPSTPYAVSRAAADMSLRTYFTQYGFPVVFTRAANVFGPGQGLYRIIPRTILSVRSGRKLQLQGGGVSERSFIHMRDVSEATSVAAREGRPGEAYHIATDRQVSIRRVVGMICERLGAKFEDCVEMAAERPGNDSAYRLDSTKVRRELGWTERISLEQGLEDTIAWVDRFYEALNTQPQVYLHKP